MAKKYFLLWFGHGFGPHGHGSGFLTRKTQPGRVNHRKTHFGLLEKNFVNICSTRKRTCGPRVLFCFPLPFFFLNFNQLVSFLLVLKYIIRVISQA